MLHLNRSVEIEDFCDKMYDLKAIVPMILSPINVIGSALVLRAIYATPELNKISTFQFIANLSISDMILALAGLPLLATMKLHPSLIITQTENIETAYKAFFDTKRMVSALTLISLSVDKVLACIFHLKYNNYFTTFRAFLLIMAIWLFSVIFGATNWAVRTEIYPGYTCQPIRAVLDVTEAGIIFFCFIVIFSSNLYLMFLSKLHQRQDREQRREANSRTRKIYEHYKSLKSLMLILCMFGIGLLPLVTYFLLQQFIGCNSLSCIETWEYLNILHYFDLNTRFVVYCLRFKSLCRSVSKIIGCDKLRRRRVAPDVVSNEKQENGVVTMVDERVPDGSSRKSGR